MITRRDYGLLAVGALLLAVLLTVSSRATPDRTDVVVTVYAVAGVLESLGVLSIGLDLRATVAPG